MDEDKITTASPAGPKYTVSHVNPYTSASPSYRDDLAESAPAQETSDTGREIAEARLEYVMYLFYDFMFRHKDLEGAYNTLIARVRSRSV